MRDVMAQREQIECSVHLTVPAGAPVALRGTTQGRSFLIIGDEYEVSLEASHIRALLEQGAEALRDSAAVQAAENVVSDAWEAGAQARTAAAWARAHGQAARQAGATAEANQVETTAKLADEASRCAQEAVRTAFDLIDQADLATADVRTAGEAARAAVTAAGGGPDCRTPHSA